MKLSICGFNQEFATTLKKEITENNKIKVIKIDCTDLVILRWFVDFYPNMKKIEVDGKQYAWLTHKKLLEDLPLLDITKRAVIDRMQKLVEFNILSYKLVKDGGTFSLYGFGDNYIKLVENTAGCEVNQHRGMQSNDIGVCSQTYTKDNTIKDTTINNILKERKKEEKKDSYDAIIESYEFGDDVKSSIYEFIKMRKLIKKPLTDYALRLLLDKLIKISKNESEMVEILNNSIERNWQGIFPLKTEQQSSNTSWNPFLESLKEDFENGVF